MHPLFRDMMQYLERQPLKVKLLSNATFPLDYCLDVIKGDHILINLGAVDRTQYRHLQGKDLFDRVVANIKRLVYLRDTQKPSFCIEISCIVNKMNVDTKQKMEELADQAGVNRLYFTRMHVHAHNKEISFLKDPNPELEGEEKKLPSACLNGWFYIRATYEGNTSLCCRLSEVNLGDIHKTSLKQVWSSQRLMNILLLGKYGHIPQTHKVCRSCLNYGENFLRLEDVNALQQTSIYENKTS